MAASIKTVFFELAPNSLSTINEKQVSGSNVGGIILRIRGWWVGGARDENNQFATSSIFLVDRDSTGQSNLGCDKSIANFIVIPPYSQFFWENPNLDDILALESIVSKQNLGANPPLYDQPGVYEGALYIEAYSEFGRDPASCVVMVDLIEFIP